MDNNNRFFNNKNFNQAFNNKANFNGKQNHKRNNGSQNPNLMNSIEDQEIQVIKKEVESIFEISNYNSERNEEFEYQIDESKYAEVVFKCKRKKIYRNDNNIKLALSDQVIVEVENGLDIATISICGKDIACKLRGNNHHPPEFTILRHANDEDIGKYNSNTNEECNIIKRTKDLAKQYNLEIKITEAEWQFDRQRLTIYFTSPHRVDFRELVKDLARTFKTRIELRQISTREEAKRIGGMGPCGRRLCCTAISSDFSHVTLDHARTQQLSNNIAKLSGYCGRLKCCLLYEYDNYVETFKKYPHLNSTIELPEGNAKILKVDIFKDIVYLHIASTSTYKSITYQELIKLNEEGKVIPPPQDQLQDYKAYTDFNDDFFDCYDSEIY